MTEVAARLYHDAPTVHRLFASYRPYLAPFRELVAVFPDNCEVLDIGCGNGLLLGLLAENGKLRRGMGFDSSRSAINAARRMARQTDADLTFEFRRCDEPWPTGRWQVVSLVDVMHHLPLAARREVISQALDRVADGGLFVYKDMCSSPRWRSACNSLQDLLLARQIVHYTPIKEVERWAGEKGLRLTVRRDLSRLCFGHELRAFRRD